MQGGVWSLYILIYCENTLVVSGKFTCNASTISNEVWLTIQKHGIVLYKLSAEYIIVKLSAYSIRDDNRKIPIDCGKCHVKHDVTVF